MSGSEITNLKELESINNTYFYGTKFNDQGEEMQVVLFEYKNDIQNRIPVTIDRIPQHVRNAFIAVEDERFYLHNGVDYKRTILAFLNILFKFYDTEQGGSTITQQLVKNLTHAENNRTPYQKIREILAAMQLEKLYSKDKILEEYLNYINFGGSCSGIQQASIKYFGKNVDEITVPEAAVLATIPKSPNYYGPKAEDYEELADGTKVQILDGAANNKIRQRHVLRQMYKNGYITYDEYQEYLNTKIIFTFSEEYNFKQVQNENVNATTWEVDALIREAINDFMQLYELDYNTAEKKLKNGGYRVYSTIDNKMQAYVEEKFKNINNFLNVNYVRKWNDNDCDGIADEILPHVAFSALRYDGSVMAHIGNLEHKVPFGTDYVDSDPRQIGSTIKPIASYGLALETDHIHWGSLYKDIGIITDNGKDWPYNYTGPGSGKMVPIYKALEQSYNTVSAHLVLELTPEEVFKFSTEKLGLKLVEEDKDYSPLSIGALNKGITLQELVGAYVPYGNGGEFTPPHIISRIEDINHKVIYSANTYSYNAVSMETAWVMNRLLKNVVDNGTGKEARLQNKEVCGKTGTTENCADSTFVGLTPDFVSGITVGYKGYDNFESLPNNYHAVTSWAAIIGDYANTQFKNTSSNFTPCYTVIKNYMCLKTGLIAGLYCQKGSIGYWKSSNAPYCNCAHFKVIN